MSVMILNVNGINKPVKIQRLLKWIKTATTTSKNKP